MALRTYLEIFLAFLKPGVTTFGGGPSAIPLIEEETVNKYGWLTTEEFADALAFGNSLPGPIATKLAALVGYKVSGWLGAIVGIIGIVAPTALAIILLLNVYLKYKEASWLKGMMIGVRPVVVMLLVQTAFGMAQKSFPEMTTYMIAGVAAIGLFVVHIHPVILIVTALTFGGIFFK
ncbi:chromate transporter [Clostridiaceae bacterium 35-E11]